MLRTLLAAAVLLWGAPLAAQQPEVLERCELGLVWSAHPAGFFLLTHPPHQFAAFYDEHRNMVVAQRNLGDCTWTRQILDEKLGWDSHNNVVMAVDAAGHLHVSGNMHMKPLVYFRSSKPFDVLSLERRTSMVGTEETSVTYPQFFGAAEGALYFLYRNGQSGDGDTLINRYDAKRKFWSRVNFKPILSGDGVRNPYLDEFQLGSDGYVHVCWVWRESADAATNNTVCYARTRDFRTWENAQGVPLKLPIRKGDPATVDPVPPGQGLLNGNVRLGFSPSGRPVISYYKNDERGTQIHVAGWTGQEWRNTKLTDYDYLWRFGGGGTLPVEISMHRPSLTPAGELAIEWYHKPTGMHRVAIHPETFVLQHELPPRSDGIPKALKEDVSPYPGMSLRFLWDAGDSGASGVRYLMRWETLPANRDREREGVLPGGSVLSVNKVSVVD